MADKDFEWLTEEICLEYKRRAEKLPPNAGQDIGEWRELREELQKRCNVTEVEAYNILRGINIKDYSQTYGIKSGTIPLPEKARKRREKEAGKKRKTEDIIEEYEERIAFLEELTGEKDDGFSFHEKD